MENEQKVYACEHCGSESEGNPDSCCGEERKEKLGTDIPKTAEEPPTEDAESTGEALEETDASSDSVNSAE